MSIANSEHIVTSSAYQTSGKPLSKEALYKAKLKYGVFESPSKQTSGFTNSADASDTAALLAASSDLRIEPYKRSIAADAQTAALLAKDEAPDAWKRDKIDLDAQYAAQNAKITKVIKEQRSLKNQGSAASAALHLTAKTIASSSMSSKNLNSLYEFEAVRNGTKRPENALNLSKIAQASKERASTLISQRTNPGKDVSRSGLQSTVSTKNYQSFAAVGALASQKKPEESSGELNEEQFEEANFAAAGALASQGYKVPEDPRKEALAIYRNQLVDPKVLAAASLNASNTLKGIDKTLGEKNTSLYNADYNKIALEIAQRHSDKRLAAGNQQKINLGGGLFMTQAELDQIASKFVNPVLENIDKQTNAQRLKDAEVARIEAERKQQYEDAKAQEKAKKVEEKRQKEEAKIQRRKELEEEKQKQIQAKKDLEAVKLQELAATEEILKTKQLEEEKRKAELLEHKDTEHEKLSKEAQEAKDLRDKELADLEAEKNEKLAPILKDLEAETEKLTLLQEEKKAAEDITASQLAKIENSKALIESSHAELGNLEEDLQDLQKEIEQAHSEEEKLLKEKEISEKETEILLQQHKDDELAKGLKKLELEKEKNETEKEKLKLLLDLENEKIDALHDEKKILETLPPSKGALLIPADDTKPIIGEGEDKLEKTFSGFTQGSDDEKELNDNKGDKKKRKSFFKEFF